MSTLDYATLSSCEISKRLGTADYIVYKILLILSCDLKCREKCAYGGGEADVNLFSWEFWK